MDESNLLFEIGSVALNDLNADEKSALLSSYSNGQETLAGMKSFNLLRKKFQSNYRMGKMYEDLSQKYEAYDKIYKEYVRNVRGGRLPDGYSDKEHKDIDRYKFVE